MRQRAERLQDDASIRFLSLMQEVEVESPITWSDHQWDIGFVHDAPNPGSVTLLGSFPPLGTVYQALSFSTDAQDIGSVKIENFPGKSAYLTIDYTNAA
jgi:hypothetical protein